MRMVSNMTHRNRIIWYAVLLLAGLATLGIGLSGHAEEYVGPIGGMMIAMAAIRLWNEARYARDPAYAKQVDIHGTDERTAFIANRAAATTFRISVLALAALSVALRPFGYDDIASVLCIVMAAEVAIYWVCYAVANRTY